jgi:predicted phage terminase large subunit-like protein
MMAEAFAPDIFITEVNGFQELLHKEFNQQSSERGILLPLHKIDNRVKKTTRIRMLGPYLRLGKLRFKSDSRGVTELLKQLRQFPNAKHDDGPDALQMAIEGLKHLLGADHATINPEERWTA